MARGWESKSVEAQIEEEDRAYEAGRKQASDRSNQQDQKLESLRLSRARIEQQLARAVYAAHREMLMKALQAIEKETEELNLESLRDKK
jgi:coenzyme F420-reducing hydrogenase delta subunit